jgi:hypothetical protein
LRNKLTITFEDDHILVLADGDKDMDFVKKLWSEVSELCEKTNCFNVLGVARSSTTLEALDAYDYARLYRKLGIDKRYRIAWVELEPHAADIASFIDTVLSDRGYSDRIFPTEAQAKEWLLGSGGSDAGTI